MKNAGVQLNALDPRSLSDLQRLARTDGRSDEALRAAAQQFEALFVNMMMKSMRASTLNSDLIDSEQTRMYQSMHDDQLALNLAQGRGMGLADALFRQLGGGKESSAQDLAPPAGKGFDLSTVTRQQASAMMRARAAEAVAQVGAQLGTEAANTTAAGSPLQSSGLLNANSASPLNLFGNLGSDGPPLIDSTLLESRVRAAISQVRDTVSEAGSQASNFVREMWPHAVAASERTGIPPAFMLAQAALETGWGEKQLRHADGSPSHNLFNIKAGSRWQGETVARTVTEFAGDRAYQEDARFRSYGSYAESFRDYATLISTSPRYADVLGQTDGAGFARSLQAAGYATDPAYADKLSRIISGKTLRAALAGLG